MWGKAKNQIPRPSVTDLTSVASWEVVTSQRSNTAFWKISPTDKKMGGY